MVCATSARDGQSYFGVARSRADHRPIDRGKNDFAAGRNTSFPPAGHRDVADHGCGTKDRTSVLSSTRGADRQRVIENHQQMSLCTARTEATTRLSFIKSIRPVASFRSSPGPRLVASGPEISALTRPVSFSWRPTPGQTTCSSSASTGRRAACAGLPSASTSPRPSASVFSVRENG